MEDCAKNGGDLNDIQATPASSYPQCPGIEFCEFGCFPAGNPRWVDSGLAACQLSPTHVLACNGGQTVHQRVDDCKDLQGKFCFSWSKTTLQCM